MFSMGYFIRLQWQLSNLEDQQLTFLFVKGSFIQKCRKLEYSIQVYSPIWAVLNGILRGKKAIKTRQIKRMTGIVW